MFAAFKTFLAQLFGSRDLPVFETHARATEEDAESRLRSLREEELFWQPTPNSWY
ncbi:hypothetical protein [Rhizobium sp. CF142]|uniref:hypothetical protein n=1 Tax=Rhizobium sp. CF142 TaxID=1144314 RepID=UPI00026EFEB7|nr:hypothetical protein [Rhizobium sp. CF142]EJJ29861.1 hypothetical protein PMI11_01839 [Rhizobium sp. CF142]